MAQVQQANVLGWRQQTPVMTYDAAGRQLQKRNPAEFSFPPDGRRQKWNPQYDLIEVADGVWVDSSALKVGFCEATARRVEMPSAVPSDNNARGGRSSGADCTAK